MPATINVNLVAGCPWCAGRATMSPPREHIAHRVGIPLPLDAFRSVTFTVRRGECTCGLDGAGRPCPHRPIRVSCFIDGTDWPSSEVGEIDVHTSSNPLAVDTERLLAACRDRWALVKALVLGHPTYYTNLVPEVLKSQRDAVFAAIAKVARLERSIFEAQGEYTSAMDEHHHPDWHRDPESYEMPSQKMLGLYVERLIERVGNLEGGQ